MMTMTIKDVKDYETEISEIKKELLKLPEGHLYRKGPFYYETIGTVKKGITKDRKKVMQLARKAYLLQKLEHLEWNCSLAQKQSGRYKAEEPLEIIRGLPPLYQELPADYFFHPSVHSQFEKEIAVNENHADGLIYRTNSGILVRSKSERTIANKLDQNRILYHYEAALKLGGATKYPDFTIYRPSDGKVVIWEHLGLMDQGEYKQKTIEKLAIYIKFGFFPFERLICTYEQDLRDPAQVQTLIDMFLLGHL